MAVTTGPRRLAVLARGLADVFATWWLGFDLTTAAEPPPGSLGAKCPNRGCPVGLPGVTEAGEPPGGEGGGG